MTLRYGVAFTLASLMAMILTPDSRSQERGQTLMDNASSAIVEQIIYAGNGEFAFTLRSSVAGRDLTDQGRFGRRSILTLRFNADALNGVQVLTYPDDQSITSETIGLSGRRFIDLLMSRMRSQTPVDLTFSAVVVDRESIKRESEFGLAYFQWNGQ